MKRQGAKDAKDAKDAKKDFALNKFHKALGVLRSSRDLGVLAVLSNATLT